MAAELCLSVQERTPVKDSLRENALHGDTGKGKGDRPFNNLRNHLMKPF